MVRRLLLVLVACSVLGHAHWFFGNLYEGLVLAPGWTSVAGKPLEVAGGVLAEGSPVVSAAVTGYIVGQINLDLFFDAATSRDSREALADRWALWNHVRLATVGSALAALITAWWMGVADWLSGRTGG